MWKDDASSPRGGATSSLEPTLFLILPFLYTSVYNGPRFDPIYQRLSAEILFFPILLKTDFLLPLAGELIVEAAADQTALPPSLAATV
nr:hypothetical protein Iba_chr14dCG3730 [Ipomoea batatas]